MLLLDELEEGGHVRSTKVIDGLETSEHGAVTEALEVVLTDVEHGGPQVELVEELGDEDVHLQHVGHVLPLHISQHINEPLKISVRGTDPEEVDFLASYSRVSVSGGSKHQVIEDGGVGSDSNTTSHHHCHLKLVPVLVASTIGSLYPDLGRIVLVLLLVIDVLVKVVPQLPGPGSYGLDVDLEEVLMRSTGQGDTVKLLINNVGDENELFDYSNYLWLKVSAGESDPLS